MKQDISLYNILVYKKQKIEKEKERNTRLNNYDEVHFANGQLDVINEILALIQET